VGTSAKDGLAARSDKHERILAACSFRWFIVLKALFAGLL
jgi:hypothetical protein